MDTLNLIYCYKICCSLNEAEYISFNGQNYMNHPNAVSEHRWTTLGDIENKIVAVGGTRNYKVELFDINSNTWTMQHSFPYCSYKWVFHGKPWA